MPTGTPWLFLTEEEDSVEIEEVFDERTSVVKLLPKLHLVLEKRILFCILFFVLFLFEVRVALSTEEVGCVISMSLATCIFVLYCWMKKGKVKLKHPKTNDLHHRLVIVVTKLLPLVVSD